MSRLPSLSSANHIFVQVTFYKGTIDGVNYVVPVHPHVYSNGHICASTLGKSFTLLP